MVAITKPTMIHLISPVTGEILDWRQLYEEKARLTKQTGCYYGLTQLKLKEKDPIKWERLYDAIHAAVMAARDTAKNVAASPGARELGEFLAAFTTPEGDTVAVSTGLVGHQGAFRIAIQFMAENHYDKNPGLREGDIITACDPPTTGTPHPGDVYTFSPVITETGELVGWAATINHTMEAGCAVPGAWPPVSPSTYTDGYGIPPTKVGENFSDYTWFYKHLERRTRAGVFNILDQKMRVAACRMIVERIQDIIKEFGLDYFRLAIRELIEESRRMVAERIKTLTVPGRGRFVGFRTVRYKGLVDGVWPHAANDYILHLFNEVVVDTINGRIYIHGDQLSPANWHALNGYQGIVESNLWLNVVDTVGIYVKPNRGFNEAITYTIPKGALYNPPNDRYSAGDPWAGSITWFDCFDAALAMSMRARGFEEETWNGDVFWTGFQGELVLRNGFSFGFSQMDMLGASSTPARPYADGETAATAWWNPASDIGSAEEWEYVLPGLYYFVRNALPGYCGHGKYRGALGMEIGFIVSEELQEASLGKVGACSSDMFATMASLPGGGYPAPTATLVVYKGTNVLELLRQGEMPGSIRDLEAWAKTGKFKYSVKEVYKREVANVFLKPGDVYIMIGNSSGGWGDPLDRDPSLVLRDVREGFIDTATARNVYGVPLGGEDANEETLSPDLVNELRSQLRAERRRRAKPFRQFYAEERQRLLEGNLPDYIKSFYRELCGFSEKFRSEFLAFWQVDSLPAGF